MNKTEKFMEIKDIYGTIDSIRKGAICAFNYSTATVDETVYINLELTVGGRYLSYRVEEMELDLDPELKDYRRHNPSDSTAQEEVWKAWEMFQKRVKKRIEQLHIEFKGLMEE